MLNVNTNARPTPDAFRPQNSRLVVKPSSKLSSSIQHNPPRSFPRNSFDHTRSLHDRAHTPSLYDFWTVFTLYTQFSMFQCWSQPFRIPFLIKSSLLHLRSWSMMNQNLKFPRYWTPKSITVDVPANYCTLSIGQATKAQTKKPRGYSLLNSLWNSTPSTLPNLALCQSFPDSSFSYVHIFLCSSQINFLSTQPESCLHPPALPLAHPHLLPHHPPPAPLLTHPPWPSLCLFWTTLSAALPHHSPANPFL